MGSRHGFELQTPVDKNSAVKLYTVPRRDGYQAVVIDLDQTHRNTGRSSVKAVDADPMG